MRNITLFSFWAHFHLTQARLRQVKTALFGGCGTSFEGKNR
jgi:hypothetical protein